jgi:hypothetical protein
MRMRPQPREADCQQTDQRGQKETVATPKEAHSKPQVQEDKNTAEEEEPKKKRRNRKETQRPVVVVGYAP